MKLSGQENKTAVVVGTIMDSGRAQTEGVCTACEQLGLQPDRQGWGQDPHLQPAGPGHPQRLWHHPALWSLQGPRGVLAFWQGPGNPAQPH